MNYRYLDTVLSIYLKGHKPLMGFISRDIVPLKGHKPHMGYISRDSVPLSAINLSLQAIFRTASLNSGCDACISARYADLSFWLLQKNPPSFREAVRKMACKLRLMALKGT